MLAATAGVGCLSPDGVADDDPELSTTESSIANGSFEPDSQFPWVVTYSGSAYNCHGTLIDAQWVLTAAHCLNGMNNGVTVRVRRTDPVTGQVFTDELPTGPSSVKRHPSFVNTSYDYDIALIRLPRPINPNPWVRRAELPFRDTAPGPDGTIASTQSDTPAMPAGMVAVFRGPIVGGEGLTFSTSAAGRALCTGDSGSGFITSAGGVNIVTGIVSNGAACVPSGGVELTNVHFFLGWIRSYTGVTGGNYQAAPADYDDDDKTDIAVKYDSGDWRIDLASNGFGAWDLTYSGYGNSTAKPVPADYDGDGHADLSIKSTDGTWLINYSNNGLAGGWDVGYTDYGFADAIPVPGDYDEDGKADLAIKSSAGEWNIDYSSNELGGFDVSLWGFGNATWRPAPGDYDGDGKTDPAIKTPGGQFRIDYSSVYGFGTIDAIFVGYGPSTAVPAPADYDNDDITDLAVRDSAVGYGTWYIDKSSINGFGLWDSTRSGYGSGGALVPADYDNDGSADWSITGSNQWFIDYAASPADGWNVIVSILY